MIEVHIRQGLLGEGRRITERIEWRHGITAGAVRRDLAAVLPRSIPPSIAVNGQLAYDEQEIPDGATVLIASVPDGIEIGALIIYSLIATVVSAGISYLVQALTPKPNVPGQGQDRGDESSPTYSWSGMRTGQGEGFTIPAGLGRHGVPGHVIYSDVFASSASGSLQELLRVVVMLSEGPIAKVGDQVAVAADGLGGYTGSPQGATIPAGIRINDNLLDHTQPLPGARLWIRPGTLDQTPLPTNPFRGATSTETIGEQLDDANQEVIFTYTDTELVGTLGFVIAFPSGLYRQDPTTGDLVPYPVTLQFSWRPEGSTSWRGFFQPGTSQTINTRTFGAAASRVGALVETFGGDLQLGGVPTPGPIEVRVRRITPAGTDTVSNCQWRQLAINFPQQFAYPGCALVGFEILATGRLSGEIPNFMVPCSLSLVRVWHPTHGFSAPLFDAPASGNWAEWTYAPGRNPAWCLAAFLTARWGLGRYVTDDQIDWPSIRRWAQFCDADPNPGNPWGEASFTFDGMLDNPRPAWETVLAICSAGHAAPVRTNGKIGVVYQYRDAHGDVAAKAPVQLLTSGLVEDLQVRWMPRADRPTVYQYEFLNEDKNWQHDVVQERDLESSLNDPTDPLGDVWRPEVVQAWGVTRPSQLRREGVWHHRVNRLIRREVTGTVGPLALGATLGDLVWIEHDVLRPFGTDVPLAMQVIAGGDAVSSITIDHDLTGSTGIAVAGRTPDGSPVYRTVSSISAGPKAGTCILNLASTADLHTGAAVAVGKADKITEAYEVVGITLRKDLKRTFRALQWAPAIYDVLAPGYGTDDAPETSLEQPPAATVYLPATDVHVRAWGDGEHLVTWALPPGRAAARARVYCRTAAADTWFLLGETATTDLVARFLEGGASYSFAVTLENGSGDFGLPEQGAVVSLTAPSSPRRQTAAHYAIAGSASGAGQTSIQLTMDGIAMVPGEPGVPVARAMVAAEVAASWQSDTPPAGPWTAKLWRRRAGDASFNLESTFPIQTS